MVGALALGLAGAAKAGRIGILPIPRDVHEVTLENYLDALTKSREAGGTITLTAPTWREMEPTPGVFEMDGALGGSLYAVTQGMGQAHYLGIQLINTTTRELPTDLQGLAWDDPVLLARFKKLMLALRSKGLVLNGVSVGNEVDVYFDSHPLELPAYLRFLKNAKSAIKALFPGMRVGTTVTFEGLKAGRNTTIGALVNASDLVFYTYYPVVGLQLLPLEDASLHLQAMVTAAQGKPIVLQELGYPASTNLGSSEIRQSMFFSQVLPLLKQSSQMEASFIYGLHDLSAPYCDMLVSYHGGAAYAQVYQDLLKDTLCTLGLRHSDGTPRPSFDTVRALLVP